MSDPLLSSLCTICHAAPPRYKCPRCAARTCSLPCSQKHKARASCSGARDPSAYVAPARLRTPAGFDHDYNFLHGIEVARGRSEREIVERRALLREQELRPPGDDARNYEKVWHGDELHHVPVVEPQRAGPGSHGRRGGSGAQAQTVSRFDVHVRRRVRALNIELLMMPEGMTRHKENKTGWNRRTSSIHWQVEWLLFDRSSEMSPRRILHKALDGMPANMALARSLEWQRAGDLKRQHEEVDAADDGEEPAKKKQAWKKKKKASKSHASFAQDFLTSSWDYVEYTLQSFYSTQWDHTSSVASVPRTADDDALDFLSWRFFLHKADRPKQLIPLASTESLASALAGRAVIEFPTVYVLSPSAPLPDGFSIGSADRKERPVAAEYGKGPTRPRPFEEKPEGQAVRQEKRRESRRPPQPYVHRGQGRRTFQTDPRRPEEIEEGEIISGLEDQAGKPRPNADSDSGDEAPEEQTSKLVSKPGREFEQFGKPDLKPSGGLVDYNSSDSG